MPTALSAAAFLALLLLRAVAGAQPTDPMPPDPKGSSSSTKIPVSMGSEKEVLEAEQSGTSTAAARVSLEQPIDPEKYICGPGDVFELNFWGQQNFRLRIAADLEGRTFISKVGFVAVSGKTLSTVRTQIKQKVRANYPGLQFDLTLISPRTFVVHAVNNVRAPGPYASQPVERVSSVLSRAGGITGSKRRIVIKHLNGTETLADLVKYEQTGDTKHNPFVLDGDIIAVPTAGVRVTIGGAVNRPGDYELVSTADIAELLELAGGFTGHVTRALPFRLVRRNDQARKTFVDLPFDASNYPPKLQLQDGDEVIVPDAESFQRSVLLIGAIINSEALDAAATSRRLAFIEGDTVRSLIERAGGLKAAGDLRRSYISRPRSGAQQPELIPVDLDAVLVRRDFRADKSVAMGDTIVVPPMRHSVMVEGAVGRAGLYEYNPMFGIPEYIAHAGGLTRTAQGIEDVKLIDTQGGTRNFKRGMKPNPGDAILVPERNFTRAEVVQIAIAGAGLILSGVAITLAATR